MSIKSGERYLKAAEMMAEHTRKVKELLADGKRLYNTPEVLSGDNVRMITAVFSYVQSEKITADWAYSHIKDFAKTKAAALEKAKIIIGDYVEDYITLGVYRCADFYEQLKRYNEIEL